MLFQVLSAFAGVGCGIESVTLWSSGSQCDGAHCRGNPVELYWFCHLLPLSGRCDILRMTHFTTRPPIYLRATLEPAVLADSLKESKAEPRPASRGSHPHGQSREAAEQVRGSLLHLGEHQDPSLPLTSLRSLLEARTSCTSWQAYEGGPGWARRAGTPGSTWTHSVGQDKAPTSPQDRLFSRQVAR